MVCTIAYTMGVLRNAGAARTTYAEISVAAMTSMRNARSDIQTYELVESAMQLTCAFFSGVRTRSARRVSTTALLIVMAQQT